MRGSDPDPEQAPEELAEPAVEADAVQDAAVEVTEAVIVVEETEVDGAEAEVVETIVVVEEIEADGEIAEVVVIEEVVAEKPAPVVDEVLLAAVDQARAALAEITPAATVGELVGAVAEEDHVLSLKFASRLPGYPDWTWTVTLARVDEQSEPSVLEVEMLPGEGSLVATDWVPWSERLAEYQLAQELAAATAAHDDDSDDDDSDDDDSDDDDDESDEGELDDDDSDDTDDDDVLDTDDGIDLDDHVTDDDELLAESDDDESDDDESDDDDDEDESDDDESDEDDEDSDDDDWDGESDGADPHAEGFAAGR